MRTEEFLSVTTLSKETAATLDRFEKGSAEKIIILKNSVPKAILLSINAYDAMQEEIEDLRLALLSFSRLKTFQDDEAVMHEEMLKRFGV